MKKVLKVEYLVDSDDMTDEQFENQPTRVLLLDGDVILEIIERYGEVRADETLDLDHVTLTLV